MEITVKPVNAKGSCLCGRVQYEITPPYTDFRYCHCERCRKATGSAHSANMIIPKDQLRWIAGESDITLFLHAEAENYPRGFCKHCGGMVPRLGRDARFMIVPAGTLEEDPGIRPTKNIFWKLAAPWLAFVDELPKFNERP